MKVRKYKYSLNLQMFNDGSNDGSVEIENTGVEDVPAAEEQPTEPTTQTEDKVDVAFAKRLAAKEKEWQAQKEAEIQSLKEQYESQLKNHDIYKKATEYLQKTSGIDDVMTLKETIEMQELQERAEQEGLPPDVLKRLEELEAKAKRAEELEAQAQEAKQIEEFTNQLKEFCEGKELDGKPLDHKALWEYMAENNVSNFDVAYKAMKADLLEAQLAEAKKKGVEEYLESKKGVKTTSGSSVSSVPSGGSWADARARALARMRAQNEN